MSSRAPNLERGIYAASPPDLLLRVKPEGTSVAVTTLKRRKHHAPLSLGTLRMLPNQSIGRALVAGFFLTSSLLLLGCRRDMFNQPYSKPLERSDFFPNQMASRPIVPNTVARGELRDDEAFYTGKVGTNLVAEFPMPVTRAVLLRGQERYDIYCAPCHSRIGDGNGMIPQRGFPHPPSYHIDRLREAPVGHFFDVITHGYGIMYPYATRVEPADRWAIAAYIRALQLSENAKLTDVPADKRVLLESMK